MEEAIVSGRHIWDQGGLTASRLEGLSNFLVGDSSRLVLCKEAYWKDERSFDWLTGSHHS